MAKRSLIAEVDDDDRPRVTEQGAVEWLFKPFSDISLFEAIQAALSAT